MKNPVVSHKWARAGNPHPKHGPVTSRVVLDRNESRENRQGPAPLERAMGRKLDEEGA